MNEHYGYPQPFQVPQPNPDRPMLICDYCSQEICKGEEAINGLYGVGGIGKRNQSPQVVPSKDIPEAEWDVHFVCLAAFLMENLPDIAEQIISIRDEQFEPEEFLCANCDQKIEFG